MAKGASELILALDVLEKEKGIDKEVIFEAIETSLVSAYKTNYDKEENLGKMDLSHIFLGADGLDDKIIEEFFDCFCYILFSINIFIRN